MPPADFAYETIPDRCGRCSKRLLVDIGGGVFGQIEAPTFCPSCGTQPEAVDWVVRTRAAVSTVLAAQRAP